ncbi:MAG: DUF4160 domain-containing protein [Sphingobacteriales bacterium]|nr:MAG: DUF4160 domain-containing protein [Sphingobacteriales bacterium]TAF83859.1 MAG: DUF4160 domain-containing protein [Sphingobacteriales bacterium]
MLIIKIDDCKCKKLFEYFGLIILFYSNEHQPIHVHGKYQGKKNKAKIIFENGEFKEVRLLSVKGKLPLDAKNKKPHRSRKFSEA